MRNVKRNGIDRTDRLNSEIKKEISEIISRKLKNPLITEMVSITDAVVTKDLKFAKIYVSIFSVNPEKKEITFKAIKEDAKRIRYELSQSMRIRTVPELSFVLDESMEYGDKMDKLFIAINKKGEKD